MCPMSVWNGKKTGNISNAKIFTFSFFFQAIHIVYKKIYFWVFLGKSNFGKKYWFLLILTTFSSFKFWPKCGKFWNLSHLWVTRRGYCVLSYLILVTRDVFYIFPQFFLWCLEVLYRLFLALKELVFQAFPFLETAKQALKV